MMCMDKPFIIRSAIFLKKYELIEPILISWLNITLRHYFFLFSQTTFSEIKIKSSHHLNGMRVDFVVDTCLFYKQKNKLE